MHPKTRYNIKLAKKKGLKVTKSRDIGQFADFWQKCARSRHKVQLPQKKEIKSIFKAFGINGDIFIATQESKWVAALMTIKAEKVTYYMYAATNSTGKKLFAPTALTWEAILHAKSRGVKVFDFEGIYDERFPIKTWKGFTKFKKGFGGYEIEYPGAYTKYKLPL